MENICISELSDHEMEFVRDGVKYRLRVSVLPKQITVKYLQPIERSVCRYLVESAPVIYTEEPFVGSRPSQLGLECIRKIIADVSEASDN